MLAAASAHAEIAGEDVGAWMVRQGGELTFGRYSLDGLDDESEAQETRRGLWAGAFTAPWDWRAEHRPR